MKTGMRVRMVVMETSMLGERECKDTRVHRQIAGVIDLVLG